MEQLQLLSVLVNHEVTADIARGFWAQYISEEYGDDVEIEDNDRFVFHSFLFLSCVIICRQHLLHLLMIICICE